MYCTVPKKRIHMQCSIPPLQPNKRIRIVISFHLHLFLGIIIHFPNGIDIPQTKRGLKVLAGGFSKFYFYFKYKFLFF